MGGIPVLKGRLDIAARCQAIEDFAMAKSFRIGLLLP